MKRRRKMMIGGLLLLALGACAPAGKDRERATADHVPPGTSGESIYDLDLELVDADGGQVPFGDLRDTVRVAAMIYTQCQSVCPRITHDMKTLENELSGRDLDGVGFVLFSLDPERDSPEALRRFARDHGLDRSRWRLFSTSEDGVRDLAAVLGVKYVRQDDGEFAHSAMIFVLDRQGVIRHQQLGLNADSRELIAAVRAAR